MHDFTLGRNYCHSINLIPGHAVADGLDASRVGSQVPSDLAGLCTAGISRINQVVFLGSRLAFFYKSAGFRNQIQTFRIDFQNAVHPAHQQDNTSAHRNGAIRQTGSGAAHGNRNIRFIGKLHNGRHFFRRTGRHYSFRRMELGRIRFFIGFVLVKSFGVCIHIFFPHNGLKTRHKLFVNFVIHTFSPLQYSIQFCKGTADCTGIFCSNHRFLKLHI